MFQSLKNQYHFVVALLATAVYRYPAEKLIVIGVTGTDGKTTTANMIYHILHESGKKVGLISTVGAKIGHETIPLGLHVTTPSPFAMQKLLRRMVDQGCEFAIVEATSHGLDQNRLVGSNFSIGVLTNITHEHLDYHKTFERYIAAKAKLFRHTRTAVLNNDGPWFAAIQKHPITGKIVTYGLSDSAEVSPISFPFKVPLPGDYNEQNALGAIAVAKTLGIGDAEIRAAIETFPGVVGRLDEVNAGQPFKVYVDFAHTPFATEQVLKTLREKTKGRLIVMFGSAGERDQTKRPITGEKAAEAANVSIVTADDPASEDVHAIIAQIVPGCKKAGAKEIASNDMVSLQKSEDHVFTVEPDRRKAIELAIKIAKSGDTIAFLGKGHQKSFSLGKEEISWNEKQFATEALEKLGYHGS